MGSCKKENAVTENILDGKIKQLVFKDSLNNIYSRYNFYYDSLTAEIHSIYRNDTLFCLFDRLDNHLFKLTFIKMNDTVSKYVHTNSNNSVLTYNTFKEENNAQRIPIYANYTNLSLDTVVLEDFLEFYSGNSCSPMFYNAITNVKCYNLTFENNNCKEVLFSYDNKLIDPCNPSHDTGSIEFTYTNIKNNLQVPFQNQFLDFGSNFYFDYFYFTSLAGSNFGKVNYNLIKSKIYYNYLASIRFDYDYTLSSDGRVSEISTRLSGSANISSIAGLTYY